MLKFLQQLFSHPTTAAHTARLLHATHLRLNVPEILQSGVLLSYAGLVRQYGFEGAMKRIHDHNRYDITHSSLQDYINVSLGRVPADYLFRLSGQPWRMEWIAIELDTKLLEWSDWIAAPSGAAKRDSTLFCVPKDTTRESGLDACFANQIEGIPRSETETVFDETHPFPPAVPTHPDCELLLSAPIGREHWVRLIVSDAAVRKTVRLMVEQCRFHNLPVEIDKTVFYRHPSAGARFHSSLNRKGVLV